MTTATKTYPQPTTDLPTAKANLDEFGYCLLANAVSREQVTALRTRLEEQAAAELQQEIAYKDGGPDQTGVNQRVWFLLNKGRGFRELLLHSEVRKLVSHVLGDEYLLSSYTANIANPGGVMTMHTDQWWMPPPTSTERETLVRPGSMTRASFRGHHVGGNATMNLMQIAPAVACNVMWMLTDFTADNGATRIVPSSHRSGRQPDPEIDSEAEWLPAVGPAGTAVVFEARAWHSTGANISDSPRLGALSYFCAPQFRQQENFMLGTLPEVVEEASDELLALLGFKLWQGYGRVESPKNAWVTRGKYALGELKPL